MRLHYMLIVIVLSVAACATPERTPEMNTIAHELLGREKRAFAIDTDLDAPERYVAAGAKIDKIIVDAGAKFRSESIDLRLARNDETEAVRLMNAIEDVFVENKMLLHILTEYMGEMLTPRGATRQWQFSDGRQKILDEDPYGQFYHFDCDLGSILILGIAEAYDLPIKFVEVPKHNFVRWVFEDGSYFNWDTNTASVISDDTFRRGNSRTASTSFTREEETRRGYLTNMSREEVKSYYIRLLGNRLSENEYLDLARAAYLESTQLRPNAVSAFNSLSWMFVTHEEFATTEYAAQAVELSMKVFARAPENTAYTDTLACAYAAMGNFEQALKYEYLAMSKPQKIAAFNNGLTCLDLILAGDLER